MKTEVKEKLCTALRSGKYKKAMCVLRSDENSDCFCVLGVLCDIYHKETKDGEWEPGGSFGAGGESWLGRPPQVVLDWADMTYEEGMTLSGINDGTEKDLPEIADEIEKLQ